jgi:glutamate/tyrosine decarboxylase-like PLP-dependent enzyme
MSDSEIRGKLVAYANIQANSTVERIGKMCAVKLRLLESDGNGSLRGVTLKKQVDEDIANGLIPAFCIATLGATGTCAFDNLEEIGPICQDFDIWLHCDAAYAGNAFCLEEYSYLKKGLEFAESLNINLHKWMLSSVACTALWMKDCRLLKNSFNVDRIYLDHDFKEKGFDVRHMQLALTRRFRALRVWFTLRSFGQENIKSFLRKTIALAKRFENHVKSDVRFEVVASNLGLVCFRLIGDCELTKKLLNLLTERKKIYVIPATYRDQIIIRFVVCGFNPEESDIDFAWKEIKETSCQIFLN